MQTHVLFDFLPNDNRDELDDRVQRTYSMLKQMIAGVSSPKDCQDIYVKFISKTTTATAPPLPTGATASATTPPPTTTTTIGDSTPIGGVATITTTPSPTTTNAPVTFSATPPSTTNTTTTPTPTNTAQVANVQHSNLEDLTMGLLVAILAEPELGQNRYYPDVISFSKDNLNLFSTYLNMIIIEKTPKLRDQSVKQILWLANQLIKSNSGTSENIIFSYIRQMAGGDVSPRNIRLTDGLLDLLIENRGWLINSTNFMVPAVIFTFMRLILDHNQPHLALLRQRETDFVIGIIREKFNDCLAVGRDFLRLLFQINKIPEFEKLWHAICNDPKSLHPTFQGPMQILSIRTPRKLILSRLTFDMERRLVYLASQIKFGTQKRYQEQYYKQFLSTPESLSLRSDLIRFICSNIHPSNEVLCSDILPRWAIVGWLLGTCVGTGPTLNSRLALYYDWLVYDAKPDTIMNIEPGILVMAYSLKTYHFLTAGLLDFFCRLHLLFIPKLSDQLRIGIKKSLSLILEKRVIQSFTFLFDHEKHPRELKELIKENFPEFYPTTPTTNISSIPAQQTNSIAQPTEMNSTLPSHLTPSLTNIKIEPLTNSTVITDNGISATNQQQVSLTNSTLHLSNQVNAPKPPNHLVLGIKQENVSIGFDPILKTNSPTDAPVFGSVLPGSTYITSKVNNNDNATMIVNSGYGDTVTPIVNIKEEKLHLNPADRPVSPEVTAVDQAIPSLNSETINDLPNNVKQTTGNRTRTPSISNSSQIPNSTMTSEQLNKNNNNMTKTANNQSAAKSATELNLDTNVSTTNDPNSPVDSTNLIKSNIQNIVTNDNAQTKGDIPVSNNDITNYFVNSDMSVDSNFTGSCPSPRRVLYPFMVVPELDFKQTIESFDDDVKTILNDFNKCRQNAGRIDLMDKLISTVFDSSGNTTLGPNSIRDLAHCLAYLIFEDFSLRIFPSNSTNALLTGGTRLQDEHESLEESISSPFFLLCRHTLLNHKPTSSLMTLLVNVLKYFGATGYLILYFLRANAVIEGFGSNVAGHYIEFCNCAKRKPLNKVLHDDLNMALIYDPDLFCFLLPSVFGEMAACGSFTITGNVDIIHLVVSTLDPVHLQELVCLCLTGTAKVINKEDVLPLIESSLTWESWEQYCVWRLICAQSVPIENYLSILPKLNTRTHSEAMSSILLNLQKVTEPTIGMLQTLINCECKLNDPFVSSILRYWSMKTDVHDLARLITSLVDSRPPSPPVKRKGVVKPKSNATSSLTPQTEKILCHLESIRQRAPKNKLLVQNDIVEMIAQLESLCNDKQKKLFEYLFLNKPKIAKKQKKVE